MCGKEGTIREVGGGRRSVARLAPPLLPQAEPEMEAILNMESPEPPRGTASQSANQSPRARNVRGAAQAVAATSNVTGAQRRRASFASPESGGATPGGATPRLPQLGSAAEQHAVSSPAAVVPSPHDMFGRASPSE